MFLPKSVPSRVRNAYIFSLVSCTFIMKKTDFRYICQCQSIDIKWALKLEFVGHNLVMWCCEPRSCYYRRIVALQVIYSPTPKREESRRNLSNGSWRRDTVSHDTDVYAEGLRNDEHDKTHQRAHLFQSTQITYIPRSRLWLLIPGCFIIFEKIHWICFLMFLRHFHTRF